MLENIANRKLEYLDQLPNDPAGQIRQLSEYDFMDEQARQAFQELLGYAAAAGHAAILPGNAAGD